MGAARTYVKTTSRMDGFRHITSGMRVGRGMLMVLKTAECGLDVRRVLRRMALAGLSLWLFNVGVHYAVMIFVSR